ncbi:transcriptional regulator, LysR-family protein [Cylindrospermum sp. NIES-4074]|nr:transcriptional regulator, LysR-family protein [Cylindrospermum sp. NIES-4074]
MICQKSCISSTGITRASEQIGLSQSATSHALGRLREVFNDPLLVRTTKGMVPTPRALELVEPLQKILLYIEQLTNPISFEPKTALGTIQIAASDYGTVVILPKVIKQISDNAPHLNLECHHWHSDILDVLKKGKIDLALGLLNLQDTSEFRSQTLFVEDFVSIVRADHPITQKPFTIESYIAWSHALITITNSSVSHVDTVLSSLGVKRRVMLKLPYFLSAPVIVSQTDLILTLPRRIAMLFAQYTNLTILEPPIELGKYNYMQIWHKRLDCDPLNIWLRQLIVSQTHPLKDLLG